MKPKPKIGGKPGLTILLKGGPELTGPLLGRGAHGSERSVGIAELVKARYPGVETVEVLHETGVPSRELLADVDRGNTAVATGKYDLLVLSIDAEASASGTVDSDSCFEALQRVVQMVKEGPGAHVVMLNGSSLDPEDRHHTYVGMADDPIAVRIHKMNLVALELSYREGISIIDVDRIVAELGGDQSVEAPLRYSEDANVAIREEFLRVIEDIGFFEKRPMLMQIGQAET